MTKFKTAFSQLMIVAFFTCATPVLSQEQSETSGKCLDLSTALDLALECSPLVHKAEAKVQAKLAECWQAGLWPNPVLSVEIDSWGGSGDCRGFSNNESSISITQLLEIGGKRTARQNVAAANTCNAIWEREIVKQDLIRDVKDAFIDAYAEQEKIKLLAGLSKNAEQSNQCVIEKAKNGRATAIEQKKSLLAYNTAKVSYHKSIASYRAAKQKLAALLGQPTPCFEILSFPFYEAEPPQSKELCEDLLDNNPALAQWRMTVKTNAEIYQLERANRIPDLAVSAGLYWANCTRDHSFFMGFDIALPVFDRNQGNICRASWETWEAHYDQQNLETQLLTTLAGVHEQFLRSHEVIAQLQTESVPATKDILNVYEEGYKQGKFECLEVLAAQGGVFEMQMQLIEALTEYHHLKSELERLAPCCSLE